MWTNKFSYLIPIVILIGAGFLRISQARQSILEEGQLALAPVDYLPPAMTAIDVVGDYAYVGAGPSLLVFDVSDPVNPKRVGYTVRPWVEEAPVPYHVNALVATPGRVYVQTGYAYNWTDIDYERLLIYDVSEVQYPRLIAIYDYSTLGGKYVTAEGAMLYVATNDGVKILDASDPLHLLEINTYNNPELARYGMMNIQNGMLTLLASTSPDASIGQSFLLIVDLTDPSLPVEIGRCEASLADSDMDLEVTNDLAVLVSSSIGSSYDYSAAEIIDISDPSHPASVTTFSLGMGILPDSAILNQLLIAGVGGEHPRAYDISDPSTPVYQATLDWPAVDLTAQANWLYSAGGAAGLSIYANTFGNFLEKRGSITGIGRAEDISLEAATLAIADGGHSGYLTDWIYGGLAVSEVVPGQPLSVAGKFPVNEYGVGAGAYTTIHGKSAYLVGGTCSYRYYGCSETFYTIDITQPSSPSLIGSYTPVGHEKNPPFAGPITIHEEYAYLPRAYFDTIISMSMGIIDVGQPITPTLINSIPYAYGITITGTHGLVSTPLGVLVMDISDPISLTLTGSTPTNRNTQPIIDGSLGFLGGIENTDKDNFLQVFDPANLPVIDILAEVETSATVYDVAFDERFAYIANGEAGLTLYDLANPSAPVKSFTYDTAGTAKRVILDGEYVYLADGEGGVFVFRKTFLYPQAYIPLILSQSETTADLAK